MGPFIALKAPLCDIFLAIFVVAPCSDIDDLIVMPASIDTFRCVCDFECKFLDIAGTESLMPRFLRRDVSSSLS